MDTAQFNEQLIRRIKEFGQRSIESRQISRRLKDLLPTRFQELKYNYKGRLRSAAKAERAALVDGRYGEHVAEYVQITHEARLARIQYETHTMLLHARQTLRAFNRR